MTYVFITFIMLLVLNIYCSRASQNLFNESKKTSMIEKCQLASDEIAALEVVNANNVAQCISQIDSLKATRIIVTNQHGMTLYDSANTAMGTYALLPEVVLAVAGNDVYTSDYRDGVIQSRAATPILYYGTTIGCIYMMEYDTAQGALIASLQSTVLRLTLILEVLVLVFSLIYAVSFSRRLQRIMTSMKIIQDGDYTHKVKMGGSDELTVLGNEFNDLTDRLQDAQRTQRQFVSDASHELKTPLASIKLLTDSILQNDMDVETTREFVADIGDEADRLTRTSDKLLSLTRVDSEYGGNCEIVYMAPTIERVAKMLRSLARKNNVTLFLELSDDCSILILEDDLYQIAFNLVENGIKYNKPGGTLTVSLHKHEDNAILEVTDTGVGIPTDALEHVFERFYRVDKARSRQTGGSGLGLAIVRDMVVRNRGEITVSSTLGKGTTFKVTFPAFETGEDLE